MLAWKYQFLVVLMVVLSGTKLQAEEEEREVPMEDMEGKFTMTTPRNDSFLKKIAIEALDTKPEDMEAIQKHPTVGNFEIKVIDKESHEIEVTVDTILGKITTRVKPRNFEDSRPYDELAWLDGRKFSVNFLSKFFNGYGKFRMCYIKLTLGNHTFGNYWGMGKGFAEWQYKPVGFDNLYLTYK